MSRLISFDYAIKYLLKDKSDFEIVEGFISAILAAEGHKPVKIKSLLESASNKESAMLKSSVADVIVGDEDGNSYIVEIDRSYTDMFLHKACFNSCRLIVDNLSSGQDYTKIKKVFHINLLYFSFKSANTTTQAPLHHGKVIFHQVDHKHPVDVHLADLGMQFFDLHNIFPEYFVISIPLFDDVIKAEIDEWLYMMKHSEVREDFKSPYMKKVAERLNILKMTEAERRDYDAYLSDSLKNRDYLVSAKEEGIEIGKAEGEVKKAMEIAQIMLLDGDSIEKIARITGLSTAEIETLKN
jgi:hypothetical protein